MESLDNLRPGDCIVCFSKNDIYSISRQIEARGLECAVIYGSLPPGEFVCMGKSQYVNFGPSTNGKCKEKYSPASLWIFVTRVCIEVRSCHIEVKSSKSTRSSWAPFVKMFFCSSLNFTCVQKTLQRSYKSHISVVHILPTVISDVCLIPGLIVWFTGTKLSQAKKFNDPDDACKILVATDAIGMGLNL